MEETLAGSHTEEGVTNADFLLDDGAGNRLPTLHRMAIRAFKKMNFQEDQAMMKDKLLEEIKVINRIHETQQRSIVDLQMNYEALDAKYQNRKRNWREKFLSFMKTVHQNAQVLQSRGARARAELREHAAHCARIQQHQEQLAAGAAAQHNKMAEDELARPREVLKMKANILTEQQNLEQLRVVLASHEEYATLSVSLTEEKSHAVQRELTTITDTVRETCKARALLLEEHEELDVALVQARNNIKLWKDKYTNDMAELNSKFSEQNKIASEISGEIDSLKRAVCNQTNFKESLVEENAQVQEKITALQSAKAQVATKKEELVTEMQNMDASIGNIQFRLAERTQQLQETELRIQEMDNNVSTNKKELQSLTDELQRMGLNNEEQQKAFDEERAEIIQEIEAYSTTEESLKEMELELARVKEQISQMKRERSVKLSVHEETVSKLTEEIEQKDGELSDTVEMLENLKADLDAAAGARADLRASNEKAQKDSKATRAELVAAKQQLSLAEEDDATTRAETAEVTKAWTAAKKKVAELNKKEAAKIASIAEHEETVAGKRAALLDQISQASERREAAAAALASLEAELSAHTSAEEQRDKLRKENASRTSALAKEVAVLEKQVEMASETIDDLKKDTEKAFGVRDKFKHENAKQVEEIKALEKKLATLQQEQRKRVEMREIEKRAKEVRLDMANSQKRSAEVAKSKKWSAEVANSQKRSADVANSQKRSAEVANSQKLSAEVANSPKLSTEVANSQKRSAEVTNSQKQSAEIMNSQKRSTEVANSQKRSAEVTNSQKQSAEIMNSQKRSTKVANSQKQSAEVATAAAPVGALKWPSLHGRQTAAAASKRVQFNKEDQVTVFDRIDSSDSGDKTPWSHKAKRQKKHSQRLASALAAQLQRSASALAAQSQRPVSALAAHESLKRQDAVSMPAPPAPAHRSSQPQAARDAYEPLAWIRSRPPKRRPYVPSMSPLKADAAAAKENEPTRDTTPQDIDIED